VASPACGRQAQLCGKALLGLIIFWESLSRLDIEKKK